MGLCRGMRGKVTSLVARMTDFEGSNDPIPVARRQLGRSVGVQFAEPLIKLSRAEALHGPAKVFVGRHRRADATILEGLIIKGRATDQQGNFAPCGHATGGILSEGTKIVGRKNLIRVDHVNQVVHHLATGLGRCFVGAHIHIAIDLAAVGADNFGPQSFCQSKAVSRFAHGCGPNQGNGLHKPFLPK